MTTAAFTSGLKVLLVDDDRDQYVLTQDLLEDDEAWHCDLDWAPDFDTGLRQFARGAYDVALVDYRLGPRHGVELLRSDTVQRARVPAIMLTGDADARIDAEAMAAGAVDYLVKSEVTAPVLKRALRYAVDRHRVVRLLERQEAEYRSTFDEAPVGIARTGLDGCWLRVNRRLRSMLGYSLDHLLATDLAALTHPDDLAGDGEARRALLSGALAQYSVEQRYRRASGEFFWANLTLSLYRSDSGEPLYFIAIVEDISERKRMQQELDHIFNLSPDMICTCDFEGRFTRTNATFTQVLGYSADQLQAAPFLNFVHADDQAQTRAEFARLSRGETVFGFTNRYRTAAGAYRDIEWHSKADTTARVIYAVARDQTDRRSLEQQLQQAQKMEAVGRLAGGVAHDFNNLLTAIIGFSEMACARLSPEDPTRADIEQIQQAGHSAATLTRQLLAFSRKQILEPRVLNVNALVDGMQSLLRRVIGEDVELVTTLGEPAGCINADRGQFEQVLMNLAVNARDAMPSGGTLRLTTEVVDADETFVATHPGSTAKPHVRVTLSDTGHGIPPEVVGHIFEPFFTTKTHGKGTGLGLATVYGIVRQSGGFIDVVSTPDAGASFVIHFPSVANAPDCHAPGAEAAPARRGSETILLVEDQPEVRNAVRQALQRQGYQVLEAQEGSEALALLRSHKGPIHLLLTDVVMPHMSGRELAARCADHDATIRVLFMSGYTDDAIVQHGVLEPGIDFIHKPFGPEQLATKIRAVLDRIDRRPGG